MNQNKKLALTFTFLLSAVTQIFAQDTAFQTQGFFVTRDYSMLNDAVQLPNGRLLVSGSFNFFDGTPITNLIRLLPNGSRDSSFDASIGTDGSVNKIVVQQDGKMVLIGIFRRYKQQAVNASIVRVFPDGTLDNSFTPYVPLYNYYATTAAAVQPDGKILVAGFGLSSISNTSNGILRLNKNGTLDTSFSIGFNLQNADLIKSMLVENDGSILVSGYFSSWNGSPVTGLVRLHANGTMDTTFHLSGQGLQSSTGNSMIVYSVLQAPDSSVLVGGSFSYYDTIPHPGIVKLHPNGTLDTAFHADPSFSVYGNFNVQCIALSNGKILAGGHMYFLNNQYRDLMLLDSSGLLDSGSPTAGPDPARDFVAGGPSKLFVNADSSFFAFGNFAGYYDNQYANDLARFSNNLRLDTAYRDNFQRRGLANGTAIQQDGKLFVSGDFNQYGLDDLNPRQHIARLNADGTLDSSFGNVGLNGYVSAIALQPDNFLVATGSFSAAGNVTRRGVARFAPDGTLDTTFNPGPGPNDINMYCIHVFGNKYIYLGGSFTTFGNYPHRGIVRLLWDGSVDSTFQATDTVLYAPASITSTADGKILAAESSDRTVRNYNTPLRVYRLNTDGTMDSSFHTPQLGWSISSKVAVGKGGGIYWLGDLYQAATPNNFKHSIIRLNADGSLDTAAKRLPGEYLIRDFKILPDSNLIVAGQQIYGFDSTNFVMRLKPDLSIDSSFVPVALYYSLEHLDYTPGGRIVVAGQPIRYLGLQQEQVQNVAVLTNSSLQLYTSTSSETKKVNNLLDTIPLKQQANTGSTVSQNFTARNPSSLKISLLDPAKVSLSGPNASEFSVSLNTSSSTINRSDSLPFTIKFTPASAGTKTVKVTIPYSNGINNVYSFLMVASAANVITAVPDVQQRADGVLVYPNPSPAGQVFIQTKEAFTSYAIIDVAGHIARKGSFSASNGIVLTIPTTSLNKGIYVIRLYGRKKEAEIKIAVLQ